MDQPGTQVELVGCANRNLVGRHSDTCDDDTMFKIVTVTAVTLKALVEASDGTSQPLPLDHVLHVLQVFSLEEIECIRTCLTFPTDSFERQPCHLPGQEGKTSYYFTEKYERIVAKATVDDLGVVIACAHVLGMKGLVQALMNVCHKRGDFGEAKARAKARRVQDVKVLREKEETAQPVGCGGKQN